MVITGFGILGMPLRPLPILRNWWGSFTTSNGYRELSGALRRRCNYLYIKDKSTEDLAKILMARTNISDNLALSIAECFTKIRQQPASLRHVPSVSEAIDFANYLSFAPVMTKQYVNDGLAFICKNHRDEAVMKPKVAELANAIG